MRIKCIAVFGLMTLFSLPALSASKVWSLPGKITYMSLSTLNNYLHIQLSSPKVGGCSGRFYMIDLEGHPMGKSMYSMLLSYEASQKDIMVYTSGTCSPDSQNAYITGIKSTGDNPTY